MKAIRKLWNIGYKIGCKISDDQVWPFSAQAGFYIIMSFFPFVMFLFTLLQYLPFSQKDLTSVISILMPDAVSRYVFPIIEEIYTSASGAILSITIVATLWSASRGIIAIIDGLNVVYGVKEKRNWFMVRGLGIVYTILFAFSLIFLLGIFVFGNQIMIWLESTFESLAGISGLVKNVRFTVGGLFLMLLFMIIYKVLPDRKSYLFRELPGAMLASGGWIIFSLLFSYYIDNLSNMTTTYGSLTTIVLCMLWLEFCMFILFMGAEINSWLGGPKVQDFLKRKFSKLAAKKRKRYKVKEIGDKVCAAEDKAAEKVLTGTEKIKNNTKNITKKISKKRKKKKHGRQVKV